VGGRLRSTRQHGNERHRDQDSGRLHVSENDGPGVSVQKATESRLALGEKPCREVNESHCVQKKKRHGKIQRRVREVASKAEGRKRVEGYATNGE
jgi:hypothetical protein